MSRGNRRRNRDFGGATFGDWALLGLSAIGTGYCGSRIIRKNRSASERRRQWEEEYDESDVVIDYGRGYYLRDEY